MKYFHFLNLPCHNILLYAIALKNGLHFCIYLDFRYKITPYYCGIRSFCVTAKYNYSSVLQIHIIINQLDTITLLLFHFFPNATSTGDFKRHHVTVALAQGMTSSDNKRQRHLTPHNAE